MSNDLAQDCHESPMWAAAEIERLTNELREARAALQQIADEDDSYYRVGGTLAEEALANKRENKYG